MELYFENKLLFRAPDSNGISSFLSYLGLPESDFYLINNGKRVSKHDPNLQGKIRIICRLVGGKGGFGSMLRAIGAQIEKTTNREACRDLSGRRLRDINEEKRLKKWIEAQAEREKEAAERKQKKLERLCEQPKHEFRDEDYDKSRSALPEKVEDAVIQGLKASCSGGKRKQEKDENVGKKKKAKLWVDAELSGSDIDTDEDEEKTTTNDEKQELIKAP